MRNLAKKERLLESVKGLHKDTLDVLQMDVTDRQSILDARDKVAEKRVDILGAFWVLWLHWNLPVQNSRGIRNLKSITDYGGIHCP